MMAVTIHRKIFYINITPINILPFVFVYGGNERMAGYFSAIIVSHATSAVNAPYSYIYFDRISRTHRATPVLEKYRTGTLAFLAALIAA